MTYSSSRGKCYGNKIKNENCFLDKQEEIHSQCAVLVRWLAQFKIKKVVAAVCTSSVVHRFETLTVALHSLMTSSIIIIIQEL